MSPLVNAARQLGGHAWTVGPTLRGLVLASRDAGARPLRTWLDDPVMGRVQLSGQLREVPGADTLVLIVHGLSGNAEDAYCLTAARAATTAGYSSLRLSLRGSDLSGEDILHGAITEDLWAALRHPELASYRHVLLLGYSVGGHVVLRAAAERTDPRLRAAAAICPPLDLGAATVAFDEPWVRPYRLAIFARLDRIYAATAARRSLPVPVEVVRRARSCSERDSLTVVPRFGFASAEDYYARCSVAPLLHRLALPSLLVASRFDPIIPEHSLRGPLAEASPALTVRWVEDGGHIHFPSKLDLGLGGPAGLEPQVLHWLGAQ